jgi:diguanylate cyclase (GGDEF)-like protein
MARFTIAHPLPVPKSRPLAILVAALLIAAVGRLDYVAGYDTSLVLLYLPPIALLAWTVGRDWAVAGAVAAGAEVLIAHLLFGGQASALVTMYWNSATRLTTFLLFALALSALRRALVRESEASRADFLTGLFNSRALAEAADTELERMRRFGRPLTLAYMDCDNLKPVNDDLGHQTGDRVLVAVGNALRESVRHVDTVARLGGDEFVVLMPETDDEAASAALERMRKALDEAMEVGGWPVTMSIGAVTYLKAPESGDRMLANADRLLYAAKQGGRDRTEHRTVSAG